MKRLINTETIFCNNKGEIDKLQNPVILFYEKETDTRHKHNSIDIICPRRANTIGYCQSDGGREIPCYVVKQFRDSIKP